MTFWHFTCEHTYAELGDVAELVPAYVLKPDRLALWWPAHYVWLSDLGYADRDGLGLTNNHIGCDRTAYRYRVTDEANVEAWMSARKRHRASAAILENLPGTRPRHWFVSAHPVPVVLDQRAPKWSIPTAPVATT